MQGQADRPSRFAALDLDGGWVRFRRPKTAISRRAPLWPETVKALNEAIDIRPDAVDPADAGLAFITQRGARWVRSSLKKPKEGDGQTEEDRRIVFTDAVANEFKKVLDALKLKRRGSFYNLRHTFATRATMVNDRDAIDVVMGHTDPSMGANYVERFPDVRLKAVTDAVHSWLFPKATSASADATTNADATILPFQAAAG